MRYFDEDLIENSRPHADWWQELGFSREWFHQQEDQLAGVRNAATVLPRDAWFDMDTITRQVMRDDQGEAFMADLMPLARAVSIGKLVHMYRVVGDAGTVQRSMSGQIPVPMDKVTYDYRGTVVPMFHTGYGREWREWNTLQSENFDALADDQEAHSIKLRENMADYVLNGDPTIVFQSYQAYGIFNHPYAMSINLGDAVGGADIDLTDTALTSEQIEGFFIGPFGQMLDTNLVTSPVNLYISKEIARNWDRSYSSADGSKTGTISDWVLKNRRIAKITVTSKLVGNQFFGFVPRSDYIRPIVGMATSTVPVTRLNPTDNYQFQMMGAMGLEIRADSNGKSGVFHSVVVDA